MQRDRPHERLTVLMFAHKYSRRADADGVFTALDVQGGVKLNAASECLSV